MKKLVISDIGELTKVAASLWIEICRAALLKNGLFTAALSGGTTPVPFYRQISKIGGQALWRNTHIFQADERIVAPDHPDNNFRMIRENLTGGLPIPPGNLHPVGTAFPPEEAAKRYEAEILKFFKLAQGALPRFDLIILGIGPDGHTASIFPGSEVNPENRRLVGIACPAPDKHQRVTLTLPTINNAAQIVFLATGKNKAPILKKILQDEDATLPASLVCAKTGPTLYLLDPLAAAELSEDTIMKYRDEGEIL
jgi:6-phosphogluconolactonase